jgi:hypothetical protein
MDVRVLLDSEGDTQGEQMSTTCDRCGEVNPEDIHTCAPPAQPAVPLTDDRIIDIRRKTTAKTHGEWADTKALARAIEAAHGITKGQS